MPQDAMSMRFQALRQQMLLTPGDAVLTREYQDALQALLQPIEQQIQQQLEELNQRFDQLPDRMQQREQFMRSPEWKQRLKPLYNELAYLQTGVLGYFDTGGGRIQGEPIIARADRVGGAPVPLDPGTAREEQHTENHQVSHVPAQRTMLHVERIFQVVSIFVPKKMNTMEIGDALELMAERLKRSPARWPIYQLLAVTVFWVLVNAIRDRVAILLSGPAHRKNTPGE